MDLGGVAIRVKYDDLEQAPGGVSADHQYAVLAWARETQRNAHRGLDVLARHGVPDELSANVHPDRV